MKVSAFHMAALLLVASAAPAAAQSRSPTVHAAANIDESQARIIKVTTGADQPLDRHLTLGLDKATIIELDIDAKDVLVSSPDIVDAVVKTPRRIFLLGTKTGQTNAFFFDAAGHQILALDIRVEKDVTDLSNLMKADLPNSAIKVSAINDNVVLTGTVGSALESTRAADLAASFAGDPKKVVNMLRVADGQQVMLKVRIAEMQRQIAKQFGINLSDSATIGTVPLKLSSDNQFGLLGRALDDLSGGSVGPAVSGRNSITGTFKALETVGLLHTLAEPNLTAVSGETAKFLAGGEFPVPAGRDQQGNISIQFKQFGVGPVLHSGGPVQRPHQPAAFHRGQRTHQHWRLHPQWRQRHPQRHHHHHAGPDHSRPGCAPGRNHGRIAVRRHLRHRRADAAHHQAADQRVSGPEGSAGSGRAVPQPGLPE